MNHYLLFTQLPILNKIRHNAVHPNSYPVVSHPNAKLDRHVSSSTKKNFAPASSDSPSEDKKCPLTSEPGVTDPFLQDVNHNKEAVQGEKRGIVGALLHTKQEQRNSGAGGSFSTVLSEHDTFFARLQLLNTRERHST